MKSKVKNKEHRAVMLNTYMNDIIERSYMSMAFFKLLLWLHSILF